MYILPVGGCDERTVAGIIDGIIVPMEVIYNDM